MKSQWMASGKRTAVAGSVFVLAACTGGGPGIGPPEGFRPYTVAAVPYTVDGNEAELNLASADAVLVSALTAAAAATAVLVSNPGGFDVGLNPPGRGELPCAVGTVNEAVAVDSMSGQRTVTLNASQCFDSNFGSNQNGRVQLAYVRPGPGLASGTLSFGADPAGYAFAVPNVETGEYSIRQSLGVIRFQGEFDGFPTASQVNELSLVIGRASPSATGAAVTPGKQLEVQLGTAEVDFSVTATAASSSVNQSITAGGPMFLRGSGSSVLSACNQAARFELTTNTALVIAVSGGTPRGGLLTLSTTAGSATVSFDANRNAVVTPATGVPQSYTASEIASLCGIF